LDHGFEGPHGGFVISVTAFFARRRAQNATLLFLVSQGIVQVDPKLVFAGLDFTIQQGAFPLLFGFDAGIFHFAQETGHFVSLL